MSVRGGGGGVLINWDLSLVFSLCHMTSVFFLCVLLAILENLKSRDMKYTKLNY